MPSPELHLHPGRLASREDAGGGLTRMILEASGDVIATYETPGQYVEVRADGETGFFVLADEPGLPRWGLVMRAGGGASDVLLGGRDGIALEVSAAIGAGFPMAEARARPLVVALAGTGLAAARPIARRRIADGDAALTHLYVGVRTPNELPMRDELCAWMNAGVNLVACLSQAGDGLPLDIPEARGRVTDALRTRLRPLPSPDDWRIFTVGPSSMVDPLRALASDWGIAAERVYTNH